jgi:hypothetical protein
MGWLYDVSIPLLVAFSVSLQLLACEHHDLTDPGARDPRKLAGAPLAGREPADHAGRTCALAWKVWQHR